MPALFAFLHHAAAFGLVAALTVELVLIREPLTLGTARRIRAADAAYGLCAGVLLAAGLLRVFCFEKGASYYFHSAPFLGKLALFVAIGLLSIYPTKVFLSWRKDTKENRVPSLDDAQRRVLRRIIHWELAAVLPLLLCAALMARGIGYFG